MKKLLLLLSLITPLSGFGASGTGKVDASYIEAPRQSSAPGSPAAGKVRWYTLDADGKFYVKNSAGTAKACTYSGDIVNGDLSGSAGITNANLATMANSTFKCRTTAGTGAPEDCTALQSQAIVGTVPQLMAHQSTPSNPAAGSVKVYAKNDNNLYILDSGGTETQVVSGGGVTGFATISGGQSSATYGSFSCQIFTTTGNNTLTVTAAGPVKFLLVGGGGGGGFSGGGGGGVIDHWAEDVWLDPGSYTVAVGAGGTGNSAFAKGNDGGDTTFAGFTAEGGGGGGAYRGPNDGGGNGGTGGSGGGGGINNCDSSCSIGTAGSGTGAKPEDQGKAGAVSPGISGGCWNSSGGGGFGAAGSQGGGCSGGAGGAGGYSYISGSAVQYAGGGGGGQGNSGGSCAGSGGAGGAGGGGAGGCADGTDGTANKGGGGGGSSNASGGSAGTGGSGYAVICARTQGS